MNQMSCKACTERHMPKAYDIFVQPASNKAQRCQDELPNAEGLWQLPDYMGDACIERLARTVSNRPPRKYCVQAPGEEGVP